MMRWSESFRKLHAEGLALVFELSHIIFAFLTDAFVGEQWLNQIQRRLKLIRRQIVMSINERRLCTSKLLSAIWPRSHNGPTTPRVLIVGRAIMKAETELIASRAVRIKKKRIIVKMGNVGKGWEKENSCSVML
jgi:hypothetical protein